MDWIKTETMMPENFTNVICTDGVSVYFAEYTSAGSGFNDSKFILCKGIGIVEPFDYYHKKIITHWQPMPGLPK